MASIKESITSIILVLFCVHCRTKENKYLGVPVRVEINIEQFLLYYGTSTYVRMFC